MVNNWYTVINCAGHLTPKLRVGSFSIYTNVTVFWKLTIISLGEINYPSISLMSVN